MEAAGRVPLFRRPGQAEPYEVHLSRCERFGTCDPATRAKTSADDTVFAGWLRTPRNDRVWWAVDRSRREVPDQLGRLQAFVQTHKFVYIGIGAAGPNQALYQMPPGTGGPSAGSTRSARTRSSASTRR